MKIPFLSKKKSNDAPKPAKISNKQKQQSLSEFEKSKQRMREYNKRLRERY